jgi:long-chain acyl-CoA synthetase
MTSEGETLPEPDPAWVPPEAHSKRWPETLPQLFTTVAERSDRPDALNYKRDGAWQKISTQKMARRMRNVALGLYSLGLRKGDRAAILAANSPEWTIVDGGCQFAGIQDVPIYTTLSETSVEFILNDSGSRIFFVESAEVLERIGSTIARCPAIENIVFFKPAGLEIEHSLSLAELEFAGRGLEAREAGLVDDLMNQVEPGDVATLIYTSGTTGEPKGVMLTHRNIISNVLDAGEKYSFSPADVSLSVLPLCHIFERTGMYLYILNGMAVNYAESIERVPENLQEVRPTIFIGVPRIFEKVYARARLAAARSSRLKESIFDWAIGIAKQYALRVEKRDAIPTGLVLKHRIADALVYKKLRNFFGGRLRFCITGGAALSDDIWLIFTGAGISIVQGYGLTETSPVITSNNPSSSRLGTVGRPIRNVEVRIAKDGEIETRGPGVMLGYYNKPELTRAAFTSDGWFRTGDIGALDEDGFLTVTDRKKELFKTSGGKYIAPSPIEQSIRSSRFVSQVVLVGAERKFPAALIVPNFEMLASYAKLKDLSLTTPREFCRSRQINDLFERQVAQLTSELSQFEKVKKFVLLENEMTVEGGELTPTLKVRRKVVEEMYKPLIDTMYDDAKLGSRSEKIPRQNL